MAIVTDPVDLDQATTVEREPLTFAEWAAHPIRNTPAGAFAAALFVAILIVGAVIFSPADAQPPAPAPSSALPAADYRLQIDTTEGARVIRTVYYRDGTAERLPDRGATMTGVAAVVVAVVSNPDSEAGCRITVNGEVIDEANGAYGGQALCVWLAGQGPVVAAPVGVLART